MIRLKTKKEQLYSQENLIGEIEVFCNVCNLGPLNVAIICSNITRLTDLCRPKFVNKLLAKIRRHLRRVNP